MSDWNTKKSADLYGINYWGANFFRINDQGHVEVRPSGTEKGPSLDLYHLVQDLKERGIRMPILLRFPDIIKSRIELLAGCFARAMEEAKYTGVYRGVYPIKVNQQKHLVEEILEFGAAHNFGLEAGSKPELLISLAQMDTPGALIICNGFKDQEYIEMALISQKLGRNTVIVVDRYSELQMIINASKRLSIRPNIGFRSKLNTPSSGRWAETSGSKSKFGLTPSEIVRGIDILRAENMLDCLCLIHFHIGSQIPSIQAIKAAIKEGARFFAEIYAMGATALKYIDVGGGLGVDYDGSGRSDSSTNYSEQEYANDIVAIVQSICEEKKIPHPDIISESGRALVAHSTALVFDVLGSNEITMKEYLLPAPDKESRLVQDLFEIYRSLNKENINEYYNDLIEKKRDTLQLFTYGVLSLDQRAKAEDLFRAIATKIVFIARENSELEDIRYALEQELSDTYFCNFSVFQSLPDSWAIDQLFTICPIHRMNERPDRRGGDRAGGVDDHQRRGERHRQDRNMAKGQKSGAGFYTYKKGRRGAVADLGIKSSANAQQIPSQRIGNETFSGIQLRLIGSLMNAAAQTLSAGIVREPWMVDLGMVLGTGFPPFRGGPLRLAETWGHETVCRVLHGLAKTLGARFEPCPWFTTHATKLNDMKTHATNVAITL